MAMSSLHKKRNHPRYSIHKIASYHYDGRQFLTLTIDLGPEGMKVQTHFPIPKDEHLNFKLVLGAESIWLKGRIAYCGSLANNQSVCGIQFIELSAQEHVLLENCIAAVKEWPRPRSMLSVGERSTEPGSREVAEE
jgi:hypothetical protein